MIRFAFVLDHFRESAIDAPTLTHIDSQFDLVRDAGLKVIVRFGYTFPDFVFEDPSEVPDATLERTLAHMDQIAPIIQDNSDVIAFVEAGWIGPWGEWHSSFNEHVVLGDNGVNDVMPSAEAILDRWLDILPPSRSVALRTPGYKRQIFGNTPLDATTAYSGTDPSRVGAHNDCFLSSTTDTGTYSTDPAIRAEERAYWSADSQFTVMSGETCPNTEPTLIECEYALDELAYMRWSSLNASWYVPIIEGWETQGCLDEIKTRLGYRFVMADLSSPTHAVAGQVLQLKLNLSNVGFAAPYNPRDVRVILRDGEGQVWSLTPQNTVDPRFWLPEYGDIAVDLSVHLPEGLPLGGYDLLLHLPDPVEGLANRPEYAIRMANVGTWEAETGYNDLFTAITLVDSRIYPEDAVSVDAVSYTTPNFTFVHEVGVEWYNIWIGKTDNNGNYFDQVLYKWYPASDASTEAATGSGICDLDLNICTIPDPVWLANGDYAWWMTRWGPNQTDINAYWDESRFTIGFDAPTTAITFTNLLDAATVTSPPEQITWPRDDNVLWYQVWVGPDTYDSEVYFGWEEADAICEAGVCTLDLNTADYAGDGSYEIWIEAWGPGDYRTWTDIQNAPSKFTLAANS